ncbi:MAG: (deoxy)nucleoside triphosphate pyrophosphohydrolase [Treponema sp.]|nr:(deoxy)nucleoside triphosphate pyrophosphohydrolase [Treponema sp.]
MKTITVSGAIILRENNGIKEIFATQRGYGDFKGGWEIPGGKLEPSETPEQCIVREIREELATEVTAEKILGVIDYDYPTFHLTMHCILCTIVSGNLQLLEHQAAKWITKETLYDVNWLPADKLILPQIEKLLVSKSPNYSQKSNLR